MPTHLNVPDQVLSVWSLGLSARQLLLVLVGGGIGGTIWQHLAFLANDALPGEMLRFILALPPFLLALLLAWYQYAGRYLEVWLVMLVRYQIRPKRYLWCSIRHDKQHLAPLFQERDEPDKGDSTSLAPMAIPTQTESP